MGRIFATLLHCFVVSVSRKKMNHLVVDLEATCCNRNSFPRTEMEIIEIGAVMTDSQFEVIDEFQSFIKPVRHPELTDFCKELTTISQQEVDSALGFA